MQEHNTRKHRGIWLSVLILFICVAATAFAVLSRLNGFLLDDSGAISLIPEESASTQHENKPDDKAQNKNDTEQSADKAVSSAPISTTPQNSQSTNNPGFEASDDNTVWSTNTQVEIFRISYKNGEQTITVNSDNGEKVIAPGTENSYTFKLKNTGDVALDYTVSVDAYFTPDNVTIPITGRLNRYDGKWIVGDKDNYVDVPILNTAEDNATLGAGKYTYYTLDWSWLFESGNDELDTMLGNLATEQDLTFTIVINTTATESADPYNDSGITPPKTGDETNITLLMALGIGSLCLMIILISDGGDSRHYRR